MLHNKPLCAAPIFIVTESQILNVTCNFYKIPLENGSIKTNGPFTFTCGGGGVAKYEKNYSCEFYKAKCVKKSIIATQSHLQT
jgi:hypothetical protein